MDDLLCTTCKFKTLSEMFSISHGTAIFAGPCSIESYEQMDSIAKCLVKNNVRFLRGGAYKPRTSPYSYQGMGRAGIKLLNEIGQKYGLYTVSEIVDTKDIEYGLLNLDIIQIGARNMDNYQLLKELGRTNHPILLKRGYMSTIEEFLYAAEYILSEGNTNVILCDRGIRTFEKSTRNTLDISGIALIKQFTTLPLIVDLSHSLGRTDIIHSVFKGLKAMGLSGFMFEVHPNPSVAKSDNNQQLDCEQFTNLINNLNE